MKTTVLLIKDPDTDMFVSCGGSFPSINSEDDKTDAALDLLEILDIECGFVAQIAKEAIDDVTFDIYQAEMVPPLPAIADNWQLLPPTSINFSEKSLVLQNANFENWIDGLVSKIVKKKKKDHPANQQFASNAYDLAVRENIQFEELNAKKDEKQVG